MALRVNWIIEEELFLGGMDWALDIAPIPEQDCAGQKALQVSVAPGGWGIAAAPIRLAPLFQLKNLTRIPRKQAQRRAGLELLADRREVFGYFLTVVVSGNLFEHQATDAGLEPVKQGCL